MLTHMEFENKRTPKAPKVPAKFAPDISRLLGSVLITRQLDRFKVVKKLPVASL